MHRYLITLIKPQNPDSWEQYNPPLGLMYLAAVLRKVGFDVQIIDMDGEQLDLNGIIKILEFDRPSIVGITAFSAHFNNAVHLAHSIKQLYPGTLIVLGGPHGSALHFEILQKYPDFDIVVRGEGEETMVELANKLKNGDSLHSVKGISYREREQIIVNGERQLIKDLDSLPFPARDLAPMDFYIKQKPGVALISSRGCPYRCVYCSSSANWGHKFRARSPESVVTEMLEIYNAYGVKVINFVDDNFTADNSRVYEICRLIRNTGVDFLWECSAHVNTIKEKEFLETMADSGCRVIFFGIDSGADQILQNCGRKLNKNRAKNAVKWAKEAGLVTITSYILGLPGECMETVQETLAFARTLNSDLSNFHVLTVFPGTAIAKEPDKYGIRVLNKHYDDYSCGIATAETEFLTMEQLTSLRIDAIHEFYQPFGYANVFKDRYKERKMML